jgi:crossover junction endodeoxyribonuclease RuvC
MLKILLPQAVINGEDAGDALAVAICHAHSGGTPGSLHKTMPPDRTTAGRRGGAQILFRGNR